MQGQNSNRVAIPIKDEEAKATFYCCWKKSDSKKFKILEKYLLANSDISSQINNNM